MNYFSTAYKSLCQFLIFLFIFNPAVVIAANVTKIVVDDTNTIVGQANNGVSIVNIATASQQGVSHNRFQQFDVDERGVIINNSVNVVNTQLGGQIFGNDQLGGRSASLIISEITGGSRSQLNGYTEIAGQQAGYIFANANGITCNGCGFINTPSVTLTTGDLSFFNGNLSNIAVSGGNIAFEGLGLNALNIERVNIFSRAVSINAAIYANDLNIVTGVNDIQPDLVSFTPQDNSTLPSLNTFSIDSSSLGGMYANSIVLVGTEKGVGVNIEGEMAASNLSLDVNGNLTVSRSLIAKDSLSITADALQNNQQIIAGLDTDNAINDNGQLVLNAQTITNAGYIGATSDLSINTDHLDNNGGDILSNDSLSITANNVNNIQGNIIGQNTLNADVSNVLINDGGLINGGDQLSLETTQQLINSGVLTGSNLSLSTNVLTNNGDIAANTLDIGVNNEIVNTGTINASNGHFTLQAQNISNNGILVAQGDLTLTTGILNNEQGIIQSLSDLNTQIGTLNNNAGTIASLGDLSLLVDQTIDNTTGIINSGGTLIVNSTSINNGNGALVSSNNTLLNISDINNTQGVISAGDSLEITTAQLNNFLGNIQSLGTTSQSHTSIVVNGDVNNNQGTIQSNNDLFTLTTNNLANLSSDVVTANIIHTGSGIANINVEQHIDNSGEISSNGELLLTAASLKNDQLLALNQLTLSDYLHNSGNIQAQRLMLSLSGELTNNGGVISQFSEENQLIEASHIYNELGVIESQAQHFNLLTSTFNNTQGQLIAFNNLSLTTDSIDNTQGNIAANNIDNVHVTASINNTSGVISSNEQLNLTATALNNNNGVIQVLGVSDNSQTTIVVTEDLINTSGTVLVNNTHLSIAANSLISDHSDPLLDTPQVIHAGNGVMRLDIEDSLVNEGQLLSNGDLGIDAQRLENSGVLLLSELSLTESLINSGTIQADSLLLNLSGMLDNQQGTLSQLSSNGQIITASIIDNTDGIINTSADLLSITTGVLINDNGDITNSNVVSTSTINTSELNNNDGIIYSLGNVAITTNELINEAGYIETALLNINTSFLNNNNGQIFSEKDLTLTTSQLLNNEQGIILTQGALTATAQQLNNTQGIIQALSQSDTSETSIVVQEDLINDVGTIYSANNSISIDANYLLNGGDSLSNEPSGIIHNGLGNATIAINDTIDNTANISSNGQLVISTDHLNNDSELILNSLNVANSINNSGVIQSDILSLNLIGNLVNSGTLFQTSNTQQTIIADDINNTGGTIYSLASNLTLQSNNINNEQGQIATDENGALVIDADNVVNQGGGIFSGQQLTITDANIDNSNGGTIQSSGSINLNIESLNNNQGYLLADNNVSLTTESSINNQLGVISADGQLSVNALALNNQQGRIQSLANHVGSNSQFTIEQLLDNTSGVIESANENMTINAANLVNNNDVNDSATLSHVGSGVLALNITDVIDNEGSINSNGDVNITATTLINSADLFVKSLSLTNQLTNSGSIVADDLALTLTGTLNNTNGILQQTSLNEQVITAQSIINQAGSIEFNSGDITLTSETLNNQSGLIVQAANNAEIAINSQVLNNDLGIIYTQGQLVVGSDSTLTNMSNQQGTISANQLSINANNIDNLQGVLSSQELLTISSANLTNTQGEILTNGALVINNNALIDNTNGVIAGDDFNINSADVINNVGVIKSTGDTDSLASALILTNTLNSFDGLIASNNNNLLITANNLSLGSITHSGTGDLTLTGTEQLTFNNTVTSNGTAYINSANLTNNADLLINNTHISGTDFINHGYIETNELNVVLDGALENSGTINQLSTLATSITANTINNIGSDVGGLLQSNAEQLTLNASQFTNSGDINHYGDNTTLNVGLLNNSGTIFTQGDLSNGNTALTNITNASGVIGANGAIDLTTSGDINNQQGLFVAGTSLSLSGVNLDNGLLGTINVLGQSDTASPLNTLLNFSGTIDNSEGIIKSSTENLLISATNIDSNYIEHVGNGVLALTASDAINNYGALNSNGSINVNAQAYTNTNTGVTSANTFSLNADNLTNAGTIQANDLSLTINDTLNNTNGFLLQQGIGNQTITAKTLINGVDEFASNNQYQGVIVSSAKNLSLNVSSNINNATGNISHINDGNLILNTAGVNNQSGAIQSTGDLNQGSIALNTLDNSNNGLIQAQNIDLIANNMNNASGTVEAKNTLVLTSQNDINNVQGQLYALAQQGGNTSITAQGQLNNAGGSLISLSENLLLTANIIDNTNQGTINHKGTGTLTLNAQQINNNQTVFDGNHGITSSGSITSIIGALNNHYGIIAANDTLTLSSNSDINNQFGLLQANTVAINTTKQLNNQSGNITQLGTNNQVITANAINNQGGAISGNSGNLTLNAQTINNNLGGVINHQGTGVLALNTNTLDNSNQGYIKTKGSLSLVQAANSSRYVANAIDVNNQLGSIVASNGLTLQVNNGINNRGGLIQSAGNLALTSIYSGINNSSIVSDGITVAGVINAVHDFNSVGDGVFKLASNANGSLNINANTTFDNTDGRVTSTAANAQINAALINNNTGNIVQYGQSSFTTNGGLNNQNGYVESAATLTINTGSAALNNSNGRIVGFNNLILNSSNSAGINNTGGDILSANNLFINSASLDTTNGSVKANGNISLQLNSYHHTDVDALSADGNLTIQTNQLTLSDDLATNGDLSLVLGNSNFVNNENISSGGAFSLIAGSLVNNDGASIRAGYGASTINVGGNIINAGVINVKGDLTTTSTNLINSGIVGAGQDLVINAGTSIVNNNGVDGSTLFSGRHMSLFTNSLTNKYSDIYASGNLTIAKDASLNNAAFLYNLSANIESGYNMILNSAIIENRADEIRFSETTGSGAGRNIYVTTSNESSSGFGIVKYSKRVGRAFYRGDDDYYAYKVSESDQSQLYDELKNMGATTFEYSNNLFQAPRENQVIPDGIVINVISANEIDESYSTRSSITAGGKLTIGSKSKIDLLLNDVSSIHANDDLTLNTKSFNNVGYNGVVNSTMISAYTTQYIWDPTIAQDIGQDAIDCIKGYVDCNVSYGIYETPLLFNNFTFNPEFISAISGGSSSGTTAFSSITSGGTLTINADEEIQNGRSASYEASENINDKTQGVGSLVSATTNVNGQSYNAVNNDSNTVVEQQQLANQNIKAVNDVEGASQQEIQKEVVDEKSLNKTLGNTLFTSEMVATSENSGLNYSENTVEIIGATLTNVDSEGAKVIEGKQLLANDNSVNIIDALQIAVNTTIELPAPEINLEYGALPEFDNAIQLIDFLSQLKDVAVTGNNFVAINPINNHGFKLPTSNNGLFVLSTTPEHGYLVETNPEFADYNEFISSDYLLERLDIDPSEQTIRLGDGFYEQRLLRDSIFSQTGQRYTDPSINSEYDQFAFLMENAVAASEELSLSIGVSLTAEQTAALTHDIVWLEETMINGEPVLVPVLYLAQVKESNIPSNGSIIAGRDVSITTDNLNSIDSIYAYNNLDVTTDDLVNRGMLAAANDMSIEANVLENRGVIDSGGTATLTVDSLINRNLINADGHLDITSAGDILNDGARITGGDITLTSTNGDVINQSLGGGLSTRAGVISGTGSVVLDALNNIDNIGSVINGNNVALTTTNGDISLLTQSQTYTSNDGKNISTRVGNTSSITALNNVSLNSGNNIDVTAANVTAGGNLGLNAANDVNVGVIVDQERYELEEKRKHIISDTITNITSSLEAGGNLVMGAGNDISLTGTQMAAGESVQLIAKSDVVVTSVNDTDYDYSKVVKKKSFGRKKTTITESANQTVVQANIDAGSGIYIQAGQYDGLVTSGNDSNVRLSGVGFTAQDDITLVADNDVTISGAQYIDFENKYTKKSGFGGLSSKEKYDAEKDSKILSSTVDTVNGDINIRAGHDVSLISVDTTSGNNTNIQADSNVLIAAGTVTKETESWSKSGGFLSGGNLYAMDTTRNGVIDISAQSSNVLANGGINIKAGSAQIVGSNLHSESLGEQGINIATDVGSVEILAAEQSRSSYSSEKSISIGFGDTIKKLADVENLVSVDDGVLTVSLAKAQYDKVDTNTEEVTHLASNVTSNGNINIESIEDITVEGSTIIANADNHGDGSARLAAEGSVIIKEAVDTFETETKETHGTAEVSFVVQNEYAEAAKAVLAIQDAKDQVKDAESALRQHKKQQDSLSATLDSLTQQLADGVPGVSQQDLDFLSLQIADLKGDDKWFEAGVALATVNLASKITGAAQQVKTAASSTGTYGFNAGIQLDLDVTQSESSVSTTTSQASTIMGDSVIIDAGNEEGNAASISGSNVIANTISVDGYDVDITASQDTYESQSTSENVQTTAKITVYGMTGGASVNGSASRSQSNDSSLTNNNSQLSADNISINATNNANFNGANVDANSVLDVMVGNDLIVASVQDTANGSSNSIGISGGISIGGGEADKKNDNHTKGTSNLTGVSGGNAGVNASNSRYRNQETVLTTLTSGGTANIQVGGNTHLAGALVATIDSEGNDLGNLTLDTGTISFDNLLDASTSSSSSASVNVNMSLGADKSDSDTTTNSEGGTQSNTQVAANDPASSTNKSTTQNGTTLNANSSSLTVNNSTHVSMSKTLATLGQGSITVGGEENPDIVGLNRDVSAIDKELFEIDSELNVDVAVDLRLFTEDGRKDIKEDFVRSALLANAIVDVVTEESVEVQDTFDHIGDLQSDLDVQKLMAQQDGGENAKILNDLANATPEQKQQAIQAYAMAYADVYGITIEKALLITNGNLTGQGYSKGAHYSEDGTSSIIAVNDGVQSNAESYVETIGHEVTHAQIEQETIRDRGSKSLNEEYSTLRGSYSADNYEFSFAENDLGTLNTGYTNNYVGYGESELLTKNNEEFSLLDPTKVDNYNEAGHYYTTFYTALETGNDLETSQTLALYSQIADEVNSLDATSVALDFVADTISKGALSLLVHTDAKEKMEVIQEGLHSLTGENAEKTRAIVTDAINNAETDEVKGLLIHVLGDAYAHTKMDGSGELYSSTEGHLLDNTAPDEIHRREGLYLDFVDNLYDVLETDAVRSSVEEVQGVLGAAVQRAKDDAMYDAFSLGNLTADNMELGFTYGAEESTTHQEINDNQASENTIFEFRATVENRANELFTLNEYEYITHVPEENSLNHFLEIKNLPNDLLGLLEANRTYGGMLTESKTLLMLQSLPQDSSKAINLLNDELMQYKENELINRLKPIGELIIIPVIENP